MEGCRRNIRKKKINTQKFHYGVENKSVVDFIDAMLSSCLYEKTILLFSSPRLYRQSTPVIMYFGGTLPIQPVGIYVE